MVLENRRREKDRRKVDRLKASIRLLMCGKGANFV
jgi:hypothetical protein